MSRRRWPRCCICSRMGGKSPLLNPAAPSEELGGMVASVLAGIHPRAPGTMTPRTFPWSLDSLECHPERGAFAEDAVDVDASVVGAHELADDREADAGPSRRRRPRAVAAPEAREDVPQVVRRDPGPVSATSRIACWPARRTCNVTTPPHRCSGARSRAGWRRPGRAGRRSPRPKPAACRLAGRCLRRRSAERTTPPMRVQPRRGR